MFYTVVTQNFAYLMDVSLKYIKRIMSQEDLFEEKDLGTSIIYTYQLLTINLFGFLPLWTHYQNEELIIHRGNKNLVLKGFIARWAVQTGISADHLIRKYESQLLSQQSVAVKGPRRLLLNISYLLGSIGLILIWGVIEGFRAAQNDKNVLYLLLFNISILVVALAVIYRRNYHRNLNKLLI